MLVRSAFTITFLVLSTLAVLAGTPSAVPSVRPETPDGPERADRGREAPDWTPEQLVVAPDLHRELRSNDWKSRVRVIVQTRASKAVYLDGAYSSH